jgi:hypothetical protein
MAALVALVPLTVVATADDVFSHDVWWHLTAGDWILAHREVPRADPFSFTSAGVPWVDHEWGFQVLVAAVHALLGVPGLVILRIAAALAVVSLLVGLLYRRGVDPAVIAALAGLAVVAARLRLQVRPELASLILLVLVVAACTGPSHPPSASPWRRLAGLAALFAVWANLHPGFLLGLAVVGAWAVGGFADRLIGGRRPEDRAPASEELRHRWLTLAACAAASCLNPWGPAVVRAPLEIAQALRRAGVVNPEWQPPSPAMQPAYFLLAAFTAALVTAAVRRLPASTLLIALGLLAYGLLFARGTGLSSIAAPLLVADAVTVLAAARPRLAAALRLPATAAFAVAAVLVVAAAWLGFRPDPLRLGFGVDPRFAPVGAAGLLLRTAPAPELYNEIGDGGYLMWRLRDRYRVFLDGRNEVHDRLLAEWSRAHENPDAWAALLAGHGVNTAVVRHTFEPLYASAEPFPVTFNRSFFPPGEWALVFWDDRNQVLLRRSEANAPIIAELEYRCLHPENLPNIAARMAHDPAFAACVRRELRRASREHPGSDLAARCQRALGSAPGG